MMIVLGLVKFGISFFDRVLIGICVFSWYRIVFIDVIICIGIVSLVGRFIWCVVLICVIEWLI